MEYTAKMKYIQSRREVSVNNPTLQNSLYLSYYLPLWDNPR